MKPERNGTIVYEYESGKLKKITYSGTLRGVPLQKRYEIKTFNYTNNSITVNIKEYNTNAQEVIEDSSVSTSTTIYTLSNGNAARRRQRQGCRPDPRTAARRPELPGRHAAGQLPHEGSAGCVDHGRRNLVGVPGRRHGAEFTRRSRQ